MKTLLTIAQQNEWLANNAQYNTLTHKWSCRGYGNSKFLDSWDSVISKRSGCGYDRRGAAFADFMLSAFGPELLRLAIKTVNKGQSKTNRMNTKFYGLWLKGDKKSVSLDGACGFECMTAILNAIGFSLVFRADCGGKGATGYQVFTLEPVTKRDREWLARK